ncbi:G-protein coupled receptor GRL101 [Stylophora pistillata]|uniref:G-protein coupled receptor GRL101 n=1 Tax=Stylophora pistillata TaxID=50429 RepID=A0A2B4SMN6_STYPI|nr:G-protein coupled receptor GRL101 [Stylophora pistillata]
MHWCRHKKKKQPVVRKMEKNKLKKLHPVQFWGLAKLHDLYLSDNKFENLPEGIFKGLEELLIIEIFNNELKQVTIDTFKENQRLRTMSLDTNLMCCHMHKEDGDCSFIHNDDFANCESMFKSSTPRKSIWVVGCLSLVGSVFVITWRSIFKDTNTVQSIMLLHLAVSDGLMGAYLITLGVKDLLWRGEYYLHNFKWRSGLGCQITGATSLLSSEVSLMLMALISADRLKNIVFPFRGGALSRNMTHIFCAIIWLVGFLLAFFPMFGLKYFQDLEAYHIYYGKSVVCLPLQLSPEKTEGWEYSVSVFVGLNLFLFMFITIAYLAIFISRVRVKNQSANTERESGLAKRVFFIIFTDCLCWMPIIVIGMRSVLEKNYKPPGDLAVWIAVFALPVNSAINPILYTLATPKAQDYLGVKVAKLRSFLRSAFHCNGEHEEDQQNPQGIEDNEQLSNGEDKKTVEAIEMKPLGLTHLEQSA